MCNLYRLSKPGEDVAHLFDAVIGSLAYRSENNRWPP